ncbi:hypothetical protein N9478_10445 [Gammaproteobacteria bacterium]|nr:hypothetical protein [Gammaproteobacteria bacterium]
MVSQLKHNLSLRPGWMSIVMFFCFYMTLIYLPWDIFVKPIMDDQEVWFGVLFFGWLAKLGGVLHWIVYSAFAYGLWHMKGWVRIAIVLYLWQVGFSMIVWTWLSQGEGNWGGFVPGTLFFFLSYLFHRSKSLVKG